MKDIISEKQDMRYLNWTKTRKSSGTAGSFLKSYDDSFEKKKYYKLSDYDPAKGIIGHECVNEIVVQRLLGLMGTGHLEYTLIHALVKVDDKEYETYLCESEDYKKKTEGKLALEDYYQMEKQPSETPFEFCRRMGWEEYVYRMLMADHLVLNRDRHGANIEVLRDEKSKSIRLSPLFDHGLSLLCRCHTEKEIESFDVTEDRKVQAFIGTQSTYENIKMIPKEFIKSVYTLKKTDLDGLLDGLEGIITKEHAAKIKEMIWKRWCGLDDI